MSRITKTIELSACSVEIYEYLTWGETQKIEQSFLKGAQVNQSGLAGYDASVIVESKYALLEVAIASIKEGDKTLAFSREWMDNLSVDDGNKLYDAVDELTKKK